MTRILLQSIVSLCRLPSAVNWNASFRLLGICGSFAIFIAENKERVVPDLDLHHSLKLTSACGIPEYTNFTAGFVGTLDHIFIDSAKLKTAQIIPMPKHEELTQFVALPSVVMPSDHIALVCDIEFQHQTETES